MSVWEHEDAIRVTTRRSRIDKVDDSGSQQKVDIRGLKEEQPRKIWRPQDFGFTSVPPKDCDGVLVQMGSRSDRTLYLDGGHQKYRPKNTPDGCGALFNQYGDIIRVFKDSSDHVHQKRINIRIGHGYNAGDSGDGQGSPTAGGKPDDASGKDTSTISVVLDGDSITITYQDSSVKVEKGQITHTSPKIVLQSDQVHLGGDGGQLVGLCGGGCATKVYAV